MLYIRADGYMCFRAADLPPELVEKACLHQGEFVFCKA